MFYSRVVFDLRDKQIGGRIFYGGKGCIMIRWKREDAFAPHAGRIFVFLALAVWGVLARRVRRKAPSPVWMIVVSAVLGILIKCI